MKRLFILLYLCFLYFSDYAQVNLAKDLIAYYPFNANANDESGNNINGVVNNATLTTDRNGQPNSAYYFNGTSSYIQLPYSSLYDFKPNDSFSISVRVLPDQGYSWPAQALVVKSPFTADFNTSDWNYGAYLLNYKAMTGYAANSVLIGSTTFTGTPCWYNIIATYKNGVWNLYVNGVLESSDLTQTRFILQDGPASKIAFGKKGDSNGDWYKGKMDDVRIYHRVLNQDEINALNENLPPIDFTFSQDICNPKLIRFNTNSTEIVSWDLGNGTLVGNNKTPSEMYADYGIYTVKLTAITASGCANSVTKQIPVQIKNDSLIITRDTSVCFTGNFQLNAVPAAISYCWQPATGLSNPNIANPVISIPIVTTTYHLNALVQGTNLIKNGNFSQGNVDFTSRYSYSSKNINEGEYFVGPNPAAWNSSLSSCSDHTGGNGNMIMINGSPISDVEVWKQTINVQPNTNYEFSTWIQALWPPNPAQLQFSINGQQVHSVITASLPTCIWTQFYTIWNSGNNTTAVISIVNKNTAVLGNDFALDDISFSELKMIHDSVTITINPTPSADFSFTQNDCDPQTIVFTNESSGYQTFSWDFGNGVTADNEQTKSVLYIAQGIYNIKLKAVNEYGCVDSVVKQLPLNFRIDSLIITNDTLVCNRGNFQLKARPGFTYCWSPARGLSDPYTANPVIMADILPTTTYYLNSLTTISGNLITNGDFSQGLSGFSSDYKAINYNTVSGEYWVGNDSYAWNDHLQHCRDHTSGNGNMLLVDGAPIANTKVWGQRITVTPNTNYAFSCWLMSNFPENPAQLQFYINGNLIGPVFIASPTTCEWKQFYTVWNSGNARTIDIAIINQNTIYHGNDFALDDISFAALAYVRDSVTVTIKPHPEVEFDYSVPFCKSLQLIANTVDAPNSVANETNYIANWKWDFGDNKTQQSPVLTHSYTKGGEYNVKLVGIDRYTCTDTVNKTIRLDTIMALVSADTFVCPNSTITLNGTGGTTYEWTPTQLYDNAASSTPQVTVTTPTRYYLKIKNEIQCEDTASVMVSFIPRPVFNAPPDGQVCRGNAIRLTGNNNNTYQYNWSPSTYLDDPTKANPVAIPEITTQYTVKITEPQCSYDTLFKVNLAVSPGLFVFQLPNAFTPNGDGKNDCFGIRNWQNATIREFAVFNRWGQKVFTTKDPSACWDGTFKGKPQDSGQFVYIIKALSVCGEVERKGSVILIR